MCFRPHRVEFFKSKELIQPKNGGEVLVKITHLATKSPRGKCFGPGQFHEIPKGGNVLASDSFHETPEGKKGFGPRQFRETPEGKMFLACENTNNPDPTHSTTNEEK